MSLVIGVLWGAVAGYAGGRTDSVLMRVVDILYSLPSIILVIVLLTVLEGVLKNWLATVGVRNVGGPDRDCSSWSLGWAAVSWLTMARIVRGRSCRCGTARSSRLAGSWAPARPDPGHGISFRIRWESSLFTSL